MPDFKDYHAPYEKAWRAVLFERARWDPKAPRTVVEIGSYEGSSAWWMMQNLLLSPESRLYCIDAWQGDGGEARHRRFMSNIEELEGRDRIEVMRDLSHNALRELLNRGVKADMLYIDGGHDAPTVLQDLVLGFGLVRKGGLVIADDYLWDDARFGGDHPLGRPKMAIDAFTSIYAGRLRIIRGLPNTQVFFVKTVD